MRIALIGCGKTKADSDRPARELYTGPLFRAALAHCKTRYDVVYIVSAFHELVDLDTVLAPYDRTLAGMPQSYRDAWGDRVAARVVHRHGPGVDVDIFAGAEYADPIWIGLRRRGIAATRPLRGMTQGARLRWFKQASEVAA